jgi:hypothetical protein
MGVDGSGLVEEITDSPAGLRGSATVTIEKGHGLALNRTFVSSLRVLGGHAPGSVPPVGGGLYQMVPEKLRADPLEGLPVGAHDRGDTAQQRFQKIMTA